MTKNLKKLELEEYNALNSTGNNFTEECLIGDAIIKEKRLLGENEKIEKEEEYQYMSLEKENIEMEQELIKSREIEIREKRYKRLMHLLNNSKLYAVILKNRIQEKEMNIRKKERNNDVHCSDESSLKKERLCTNYSVGEVLTEKLIDENFLENEKKNSQTEILDADFFKSTRVTDLGFTVSYKQPIMLEGAALRDYQLQGLEWMINLFMNGVNGILADEMGLGKTIQVIAFICYLIEQNIKGPFLILAPLSTLSNWMSEFNRFAPKVSTLLYYGSKEERKVLFSEIFQTSKCGNKTAQKVVITPFHIPVKDKAILEKINWYYLIIDEGHRIKNHNSLLSRTLRDFNTIGRLLLTGTPLQNDLSELWSLLNFILPEVFTSLDVFESWFDIRELQKNDTKYMLEKFNIDVVNIMQEILLPFLLRREKKDVNLRLPPKREILIYCPMTQLQKELYQKTIDRSIEYLLKPNEDVLGTDKPLPKRRCFLNSPYGKNNSKQSTHTKSESSESSREVVERFSTNIGLGNPQMQLRKIVNHPYLIQYPLKTGTEELRIDEDIIKVSGKLLVLDAMLAKLKNRGHKVVIFSCFKLVLDILEDYVVMRNYSYCRLDGDSGIDYRNEEILRFNSDPTVFIFLISIRAGGLGINLTAADTVILYDSDWNPQVNLQSQDRCHRIGQTKPVVVYRLCAIGTIDQNIIERGNAKRRLEKMILPKGKFTLYSKNTNKVKVMDLQELKKLLESTDHDTVINSNGFETIRRALRKRDQKDERGEIKNFFQTLGMWLYCLKFVQKLHKKLHNRYEEEVLTDEELEALLDRSDLKSHSSSEESENKVFKVLNYQK